jgi:hypothetical protein
VTLELWCPFAEHRPLGPQTEPNIGVPRIFLVHTMVGFLRGTDSMFRQAGFSGTESTFGVGGDRDPAGLDGAIWQWQDLAHSADAQFAGNAYATSVETSDGGHPNTRWSPKQAESLVRLGVWWCKATGNPARLVTSPDGRGFGWHAQFKAWNENGHDCPGAVRLAQYKAEIVPEIARRLGQTDEGNDVSAKDVWQQELEVPYGSKENPEWQAGNLLVNHGVWLRKLAAKLDAQTATLEAQNATIKALAEALAARDGAVDVDALIARIRGEISHITVHLDAAPEGAPGA